MEANLTYKQLSLNLALDYKYKSYMTPNLLKLLNSSEQFVNSNGVLITIFEGSPRRIYARAAYNSKSIESVRISSDTSIGKLHELTLNDIWMLKRKTA
jgi:hypothetical protein